MSSYSKLKNRNKELEKQILELVINPDSLLSTEIKLGVKLKCSIENAIMEGTPTNHLK